MNIQTVLKHVLLFTGTILISTQVFAQGNSSNITHLVVQEKPNVKAKTKEDDQAITRTVKQLINENKILSKLNLEVSTNKGIVKIKGNVDSETEADELIAKTESVIGVSDVDVSELTIKESKHPIDDTVITAKIKGLLIREDLFGEKDVASVNTSVETIDGIVYLSGVVDNEKQINNAIEIIKKNVPNVKEVKYIMRKITPIQNNSE